MAEMVDHLFRQLLELFDVSDRTGLECVIFANTHDRCLCAGGYSSAAPDIVAAFGSSTELGTVGLSMYLLGFAIGKSQRTLAFST
jgi:hypothetical protein